MNPQRGIHLDHSSITPATGIRTRIIGVDEHSIRVSPQAGCDSVTVGALVTDSPAGRKINLDPAMEDFAVLAQARTAIVATGLYHWPGGKACNASIIWARAGRWPQRLPSPTNTTPTRISPSPTIFAQLNRSPKKIRDQNAPRM